MAVFLLVSFLLFVFLSKSIKLQRSPPDEQMGVDCDDRTGMRGLRQQEKGRGVKSKVEDY